MLRIRLTRLGRRHRPFYRIVVIEGYKKRDGAYIEALGWYDPLADKSKKFFLKQERYDYWISKGAQPSDAILKLILPVEEKKKLWPDKAKADKTKPVAEQKNNEKSVKQVKEAKQQSKEAADTNNNSTKDKDSNNGEDKPKDQETDKSAKPVDANESENSK